MREMPVKVRAPAYVQAQHPSHTRERRTWRISSPQRRPRSHHSRHASRRNHRPAFSECRRPASRLAVCDVRGVCGDYFLRLEDRLDAIPQIHAGSFFLRRYFFIGSDWFRLRIWRSGGHVFCRAPPHRCVWTPGARCFWKIILAGLFAWNCGNQSSGWTDFSVWRLFFRVAGIAWPRDRALGRFVGAVPAFRRFVRGISLSRLQLVYPRIRHRFLAGCDSLSLLFAAVHLQNSGEGSYRCRRRFRSWNAMVFLYTADWQPVVRRGNARGLRLRRNFSLFRSGQRHAPARPPFRTQRCKDRHGLPEELSARKASVFDFLLLFIFFYVIHRLYPASCRATLTAIQSPIRPVPTQIPASLPEPWPAAVFPSALPAWSGARAR